MAKLAQKTKELSAFQCFENFTKALIAVPKKDLQEKLDKYKRDKRRRKLAYHR